MNVVSKVVNIFRKAVVSLQYEPANVSSNATVSQVQGMIRSAEAGETRQLFALYRDLTISGSHVQTELTKRKLAVIAQPHAILPIDKENPEDVAAAEAVRAMIDGCENWLEGLTHLLDATIWPVAVVEKLFMPAGTPSGGASEGTKGTEGTPTRGARLQYLLRRLEPVNPTVLCFRKDWYGLNGTATKGTKGEGTQVNDAWESELRFYSTDADGRILYNYGDTYAADRDRHLVYRGHLLIGHRDNWGGPMRAIVFWWLLGVLGRDWFGRYMERYGNPFLVGKTDSTSTDAVNFLKDALSLSTKIGGLVVDHDTEVELVQAMTSNGADAFERFLSTCNKEISKVIVGQTLSSEAQATGLGSGTSKLQGEVRDDYKAWDQIRLGEALRQQVFTPFLQINGLRGAAPKIVWGDLSAEEGATVADLLMKLAQASLEPTDDAIPTLSEKVGFELQRRAAPEMPTVGGGFGGGSRAMLTALFARTGTDFHGLTRTQHPSDRIVAARAKALGDAYRGSMAPFRQIILASSSKEECLRMLQAAYVDWKPDRLNAEFETALQICAAAGAAAEANV